MMRNTINKRKGPIICAAVIIGALCIYLAVVLFLMLGVYGELMALCFLLLYGLVILVVIAGIIMALRQRLREIRSGEEEEAKQY